MARAVYRDVPSRTTEAMLITVGAKRHRSERGRIVPKLARSQSANLLQRTDLVNRLVVTDLPQITIVCIQRCRVSSREVQIPLTCQPPNSARATGLLAASACPR